MTKWNLSAASGRDHLVGSFRSSTENRSGLTVLDTRIVIKGEFWPRSEKAKGDDPVHDYEVLLSQVQFDWRAVDELIHQMDEWLDLPKEISIDLCAKDRDDQSFVLSFGRSSERISSIQRPACSVIYRGTVFVRGEWLFVVDQSCIRNFRDELRLSLNETSRAATDDSRLGRT
jgi:hypothetical protein